MIVACGLEGLLTGSEFMALKVLVPLVCGSVCAVLVLSLSYVTSWVITGVALFLYYRRGTWLERAKNRITAP